MIDTKINVDSFNSYSAALVLVFLAKGEGLLVSFNNASFRPGFDYKDCLDRFKDLGILNSRGIVQGINMIMKDCEIPNIKSLRGHKWDHLISLYDMVNFDIQDKQLPFEYLRGIYSIFYFFSNFDYEPLHSKKDDVKSFELELKKQITRIKKEELNDIEYSE